MLEAETLLVLKTALAAVLSRLEVVESANVALTASNVLLTAENALLKAENIALRSQLHQNSKNSNKPPSSDGLKKKPALSQSKGKASGGQHGHTGKTLKMVEKADCLIVPHAVGCSCCNKVFAASDVSAIVHRRQVFDIPMPRLEVTEHQIGAITCCGHTYQGTYPVGVSQPVQYGSKIKALSVLLNVDYKLPFEKIEQLLGDIYHCTFNESTAISANVCCYHQLEATENTIKAAVLEAEVAYCDETGMRVAGKLHWFHVAATTLFTYLFVHAKRGILALKSDASLLGDLKNWMMHDCWKSYFQFTDCQHAICNAHILRELEALKENGSKWAVQMQVFLIELFTISEKATLIVPDKTNWVQRYELICKVAHEEEPTPTKGKKGRPKNSKGRNLLNRLVEHQDGVLAFAFNELVPFTNNQAERDIRCLKTKQKVATSFRTFKGAQQYARIQSFVSTLRKHNMNVFQNLIRTFDRQNIAFQHA